MLLRATFLEAGEHWINGTMLSVCVVFLLSLATLTPPHDWRDLINSAIARSAAFLKGMVSAMPLFRLAYIA